MLKSINRFPNKKLGYLKTINSKIMGNGSFEVKITEERLQMLLNAEKCMHSLFVSDNRNMIRALYENTIESELQNVLKELSNLHLLSIHPSICTKFF